MKKNIQINKKRILPFLAGILFVGLTLKSIDEISPKEILSYDNSQEVTVFAANIDNLEELNAESIDVKKNKPYVSNDVDFNSKVAKVRELFKRRNAPLADYAEEFVKAADHYNIDYRLIAAISIIESGGGKHNFRPYNAWGWGKSGFENWTDGIWKVSAGLSRYYSRGLTTPRTIAPVYCPPNATKWASNVQLTMDLIASY